MNLISHITIFFTVSLISVFGRKHVLVLNNDIRKYFSITTFGFFSNGQLEVHLNYLTFLDKYDGVFGLTLAKTVSDSIAPYMESHQNKCLLVDEALMKDGNIEIISFLLDPKANEVQVNCSRLSAFLDIQPSFDFNTSSPEPIRKQRNADTGFPNFAYQTIKQKRAAVDDENNKVTATARAETKATELESSPNPPDAKDSFPISDVPADKKDLPVSEAKEDQKENLPTSKDEHVQDENSPNLDSDQKAVLPESPESRKKGNGENDELGVSKICTSTKLTYQKKIIDGKWKRVYDLKFYVSVKNKNAEGLYSLYFHNCAGMKEAPVPVNLSISITERNGDSYLSAGEIPLPRLYFLVSLVFFISGCVWISILKRKKEEVFKIHYLMGLLVFVKSLSLLFHGINFHIIGKDGSPMEAWAVLYYITHLLKGALLFITIVLIGTGWAFIKHILSDKDKKIFMIVIPLQVLSNVAKIIMEESEEGNSQHYTWREVFILVDLVCCGAILFPVVWSIRHLQEASHIDGKAAINLAKLKLFRRFYIMIVCYIYFTRIIVYLLKITVPFQYEWLDEMFRETATFIFYVLTGYNFRPTTSNPYFRLSQDDDLEMDCVITQTGFTEQATKTVRSRDLSAHNDETIPTKRESSHEYD